MKKGNENLGCSLQHGHLIFMWLFIPYRYIFAIALINVCYRVLCVFVVCIRQNARFK